MSDATVRPADGAPGPGDRPREQVVLTDAERRLLASVADLSRFDRVERVVHWVNAALFAIMVATGSILYVPFISTMVGRREAVKTIHVYTGLLLPFPLLIAIAGRRWGRGMRADLRRLNRWIPDDRVWLKERKWKRGRPLGRIRLGKFNPGQKLNAAFTGGAIVVMLATGSIMRWYKLWPLRYRTGATFVHDWIYIGLVIAITGHILFALRDPDSMSSMWQGKISRKWAGTHAPRWLEEVDGAPDPPAADSRSAASD